MPFSFQESRVFKIHDINHFEGKPVRKSTLNMSPVKSILKISSDVKKQEGNVQTRFGAF